MSNISRVILSPKEFKTVRHNLHNEGAYFVGGSNSVYVPSHKAKYLMWDETTNNLVDWPDEGGEVVKMTFGEAARTELKREWPELKRVGWPARLISLFDKTPPFACLCQYSGEVFHFDLIGAYWQIYRELWLDVAYPRGMGRKGLYELSCRVGRHKGVRNAVMGAIRARYASAWHGWQYSRLTVKNNFLSPCLWATVMDILHELAGLAIDCGAIYVATDGFIIPAGLSGAAESFSEVLSGFGLEYRVNVADCRIIGWGNYRVGEKKTASFSRGLWPEFKQVMNVNYTGGNKTLDFLAKVRNYNG